MFLELKPGIRTALLDGTLVPDSPKHMATEMVYSAQKGDRIRRTSENYVFAVAFFTPDRDEKYINTYAYQKESNWTAYTRNLTPDSYTGEEYEFTDDGYFRVCVKRADGADISEEDIRVGNTILEFQTALPKEGRRGTYFPDEIERTSARVLEKKKKVKDSLTLALLADTHYTVNGTWEDTVCNLKAVHDRVSFDAVLHLGDFTDGVTSKRVTEVYAKRVLDGLKACGAPVYVTPGNHDANYFLNNTERMDSEEQLAVFGEYMAGARKQGALYYCVDIGENLRFIFLSSFDVNRPVRYGFDDAQLAWLKKILAETEKGKKILIFCHDAPTAELDYWSYYLWNEEKLLKLLTEYQEGEGHHILAYFHGHTHADAVCLNYAFPIVSTGCSKCEYFTDKKPAGSHTPERRLNTVSQELWDIMVIDTEGDRIDLVRFGAGEDRSIDCRKIPVAARNITECNITVGNITVRNSIADIATAGALCEPSFGLKRRPAIWAHRGVSGHAPENTLPAFELAVRMGCDGVELDVQMTKDGELVVIHDERIDRVSDGQGFVRDYTLAELKRFNFNRSFPAWGRVTVPTLKEVYELLKDTGLLINLELKNSVCFYKGMEEKALELARRMGMAGRILYSSFNHYSMRRIKELDPEAETAFLYSDGFLDMPDYAKKNGVCAVHPAFHNLQYPGLIGECRRKGIRVHVWTVNEKEDFKKAAELGVDAVITNYPERGTGRGNYS